VCSLHCLIPNFKRFRHCSRPCPLKHGRANKSRMTSLQMVDQRASHSALQLALQIVGQLALLRDRGRQRQKQIYIYLERERERERESERDRQTDRETDRETETERKQEDLRPMSIGALCIGKGAGICLGLCGHILDISCSCQSCVACSCINRTR
jgi:hypothetical protein